MSRPPTYDDVDKKLRERMRYALSAWIAEVGQGLNKDPLQSAASDLVRLYDLGASEDDWHVAMMKLRLSVQLKGGA